MVALLNREKKRYGPKPTDSSVTKKVKKDFADLSDSEFKKKYQTTKNTYAKRVDKYGDPYMNSPLAKFGKKMENLSPEQKRKEMAGITAALAVVAAAASVGVTYAVSKKINDYTFSSMFSDSILRTPLNTIPINITAVNRADLSKLFDF